MKIVKFASLFILLASVAPSAWAAESMSAVDTLWVVVAAALVFFMQAGFALLESGCARSKNSINVIMKNYVDVCIGSMIFWFIGYGLMFGRNPSGWLGLDHFLWSDLTASDYTFILFQTMFAATAATIVSGAIAERTLYQGYLMGAVLTTGLIYPVFGAWAWGSRYEGQGWLANIGFIDFAGSTVVHGIGGWVALAALIVIKPRLGRYDAQGKPRHIPGHNLTSVALGGFILWLGWFGFNGGSTLQANTDLGLIVLNTHLAACSGAVGALLYMLITRKPMLMTMTVNGSIGGLVAITAGCATMTPSFAIMTGILAGALVVYGMGLMDKFRLDDVVGAVPVHGFCGAWGTLAAGLFYHGDLFNMERIIVQLIGVGVSIAWAFPVALIMYSVIRKVIGLRASTIDEQRGLDYSEHYEVAYPEFESVVLHKDIKTI